MISLGIDINLPPLYCCFINYRFHIQLLPVSIYEHLRENHIYYSLTLSTAISSIVPTRVHYFLRVLITYPQKLPRGREQLHWRWGVFPLFQYPRISCPLVLRIRSRQQHQHLQRQDNEQEKRRHFLSQAEKLQGSGLEFSILHKTFNGFNYLPIKNPISCRTKDGIDFSVGDVRNFFLTFNCIGQDVSPDRMKYNLLLQIPDHRAFFRSYIHCAVFTASECIIKCLKVWQ
jgi:hypothetical protein